MSGYCIEKSSMEYCIHRFSQEMKNCDIEHFVMFGTLLGLTRDGEPISGDDDVDFYVNMKHRESVSSMLKSIGLEVDYSKFPNDTKYFTQVQGILDGEIIRVDFYFYDADSSKDYILDNWNFAGKPSNADEMMKLPKPFVYPLKSKKYLETDVVIPNHPELICEFLYGASWTVPKKKNIDYHTKMVSGRPIRISINNGVAAIID